MEIYMQQKNVTVYQSLTGTFGADIPLLKAGYGLLPWRVPLKNDSYLAFRLRAATLRVHHVDFIDNKLATKSVKKLMFFTWQRRAHGPYTAT